jgi:hypothetical protein
MKRLTIALIALILLSSCAAHRYNQAQIPVGVSVVQVSHEQPAPNPCYMLGAARNGAISGGLRRNQRSQGGAAARLFESMGEDAVQHSTASFYIFSLPGDSGLRYDPILRANC